MLKNIRVVVEKQNCRSGYLLMIPGPHSAVEVVNKLKNPFFEGDGVGKTTKNRTKSQ
jgi:hypothetical protein